MDTKYFDMTAACEREALAQVAQILKNSGVVAIPTETVYGLAANALDVRAVSKIFEAKGRPQDNPLIVHIAKFDDVYALASRVPECAKLLAQHFWPGPLTMILPRSNAVPRDVSAGLDTVAIRIPSHPIAQAILTSCGLPLAAPSANISGSPSPTTAAHVLGDLGGKIDAVVDGGPCDVGIESTVITLCSDVPRILRPGKVTLEELRAVLGDVELDPAVMCNMKSEETPASPGMKYRHYAPKAKVFLLRGDFDKFKAFIHDKIHCAALCFDGEESALPIPAVPYGREDDSLAQAHHLFEALRKTDEMQVDAVYIRYPKCDGVRLAVLNRLLRAAQFEVIDL